MSQDHFSEVTSQSWISRLGSAFKGIVVGLVLFIVGFPVLFWNEGRAVREAKGIAEGVAAVVAADAVKPDPANNGKLVHLTGLATTEDTLSDSDFGVSAGAIKLRREVRMFQWKETEKSEKRTKMGGGTETVTTYDYSREWAADRIDSGRFKQPEGHANPEPAFASRTWTASRVALGGYVLPEGLVAKINAYQAIPTASPSSAPTSAPTTAAALPAGKFLVRDGGYYRGADPAQPQVGDLKISFASVAPLTVSTIARQAGTTLEPYTTAQGTTINYLETGTRSAVEMFAAAEARNRMFTWLLRLGGFLAMFIGLAMIFAPLGVVADVLPFLGGLVRAGTGIVAFLIALPCALLTIGIAWLVYRPVLGIGLLAIAAAAKPPRTSSTCAARPSRPTRPRISAPSATPRTTTRTKSTSATITLAPTPATCTTAAAVPGEAWTPSLAILLATPLYLWNFAPHPFRPQPGQSAVMWIPDVLLWAMLLVLELIGAVIKPFALMIRLFANMIAGHLVLAVFITFIPVTAGILSQIMTGVPITILSLLIRMLELFVAFLQAYIFTFLTTLFIASAVAPEH